MEIFRLNDMDILTIIQDRTFDAECAKRVGLYDLQSQILNRINATYPEYKVYISQCCELYSMVGDFLTTPRGVYLKEHLKTIKLKYK